jgi:hypothetical protein
MEVEAMTQAFNVYCDESCHLDLPGVSIYPLRELCAIIEKRKIVAIDWEE